MLRKLTGRYGTPTCYRLQAVTTDDSAQPYSGCGQATVSDYRQPIPAPIAKGNAKLPHSSGPCAVGRGHTSPPEQRHGRLPIHSQMDPGRTKGLNRGKLAIQIARRILKGPPQKQGRPFSRALISRQRGKNTARPRERNGEAISHVEETFETPFSPAHRRQKREQHCVSALQRAACGRGQAGASPPPPGTQSTSFRRARN